MNVKLMGRIIVVVLMGMTLIGSVYSQEPNSNSHEEHHPDSKVIPAATDGDMKMGGKEMNGMEMAGKDGVMDKADMKKMNAMMKDCMKIHKDKKMCDQNMMKKEK